MGDQGTFFTSNFSHYNIIKKAFSQAAKKMFYFLLFNSFSRKLVKSKVEAQIMFYFEILYITLSAVTYPTTYPTTYPQYISHYIPHCNPHYIPPLHTPLPTQHIPPTTSTYYIPPYIPHYIPTLPPPPTGQIL